MHRVLIVGRMAPGAEERIAKILGESDGTELSGVTGVRHRSLYRLDDLCLHLMETPDADPARLARAEGHPLFRAVTEALANYVSPYSPNWRSPRDAMARCFYRWDAPAPVTGTAR